MGSRVHVYLLSDEEPRALLPLLLVRLLADRFKLDLALQVVGHVALLLFAAEKEFCLLELVLLLIVRRNLVPDRERLVAGTLLPGIAQFGLDPRARLQGPEGVALVEGHG